MPANVTGNFSAAGGVTHMDCVFQVKLLRERREIVGVSIHFVAIPRLGGTAVTSPVMRYDAITTLSEKQHLSIPVVRRERPPVTEHYGLACSPVLVENLRTIFRCDCGHSFFSLTAIVL
jgi:hypothetical protein